MAMGNTQQSSPYPRMKYSTTAPEAAPPQTLEDFDRRWKAFIQSLDVTPQNIQNIDQLEAAQKIELLLNFEAKNPKCSAFHYVTLIKGLRSFKITNSKKKDEFQNAKQILSSTEISLRTNNVEWVYDFLKHNGLETLVDYMSQTLLHLIKTEDIQISPIIFGASSSLSNYPAATTICAAVSENGSENDYLSTANQSLIRIFDGGSHRSSTRLNSSKSRSSGIYRNTSSSVSSKSGKSHHTQMVDSIKECLHLSLKCFRTILNNQKGCRLAFEHKDTINVITMCLLHPHYQTKSLVLDLLSAVCLIEGGHERVMKSFDLFKAMSGEERRFETLMYYYRHHETLPLDDYNIDYAVSNMQFINIVVHSVENINLRVYMQYEFCLLGLDDFLKKLQERPGDRLNRQVDAYLDNMVDCNVLLEDAEAKEAYVAECERLEKDVSSMQEALTLADAEKARKIKESDDRVRKAEKELEKAKNREDELSLLVESLRSKIRDINVNLSDRETDMKRQIDDLQDQLKKMNILPLPPPPLTISDNVHNNNVAAGGQSAHPPLASGDVENVPVHANKPHSVTNIPVPCDQSNNALDMTDNSLPYRSLPPPPPQLNGGTFLQQPPHISTKKDAYHHVPEMEASAILRAEKLATDELDLVLNEEGSTDTLTRDKNMNVSNIMDMSSTSVPGDAPLIKWNILRNQQGTVFEEIDESRVEKQLDLDGFERIFKVPPVEHEYDIPPLDTFNGGKIKTPNIERKISETSNVPSESDQSDKISLLDANRQKCLKVVVSFLKQVKLLNSESNTFRDWGRPIAYAITNFDMPSEAADRLLYQLPSYQEIDMYRDITGDNLNVLSEEDRLVALLSCIDRVEMKLEAILYMEAFDETYFALQEKIRVVTLACGNVMASQKLKKILEIVLAFGNRMNDSRRGKAFGFRIQSLDMLPECRSPDDKWSLMNYIVHCIEEKFKQLIEFTSEMEYVEDASRVSLCNLMAAIEELSTGLDRVSEELNVIEDAVQNNPDLIPSRLVIFVKENTNRVAILRNQADQARIAFVKTVEWFGEKDIQTASPDLFFGALNRFMECFKKAIAENYRRKIGHESHRKKHKDRKLHESKPHELTKKKNRTRQINGDGIMDEILAGLDYQPLQAGIHARRNGGGKRGDSSDPMMDSGSCSGSIYQDK